MRSGENARQKSSPTFSPLSSSIGSRSSRVVPGYVVLSSTISWPERKPVLTARGLQDEGHVGIFGLVQGRRHADAAGVGLGQGGKLGGGGEPTGFNERAQVGGQHILDVAVAFLEPSHPSRVYVNAGHVIACLGKSHSQRQADVAQSDDRHVRGAVRDLLKQPFHYRSSVGARRAVPLQSMARRAPTIN